MKNKSQERNEMEYISIQGAAQRLGMKEKEVNKLIEEGRLESKTSYGLTTVTKESVYAYTGISADGKQTKKNSKAGRPPATVTFERAAKMLDDDISDFVDRGVLETYQDGDVIKITERSIKGYKRKNSVAEAKKTKEDVTDTDNSKKEKSKELCTYPYCKCPFDMGEDSKCFMGFDQQEECLEEEAGTLIDEGTKTYDPCERDDSFDMSEEEESSSAKIMQEELCLPKNRREEALEETIESLKEVAPKTDFEYQDEESENIHAVTLCEMDDKQHVDEDMNMEACASGTKKGSAENYFTSEEYKRKCMEADKYEKSLTEKQEETITMSKRDFHAHLNVASMRAELMVYRSLKSFDRR